MLKTETAKFLGAIHSGDLPEAQKALNRVQTKLDQVAAKGTLHRNTVARRKSRLARKLNQAIASSKSG